MRGSMYIYIYIQGKENLQKLQRISLRGKDVVREDVDGQQGQESRASDMSSFSSAHKIRLATARLSLRLVESSYHEGLSCL